jgi:uncharacterized membrane protein YoaK (UPF0700 family)
LAERAVNTDVPTFAALREQAARSVRHPLTRTLLALTFTTGMVDAVSYLGLGRVFTANMTGNVVLLGFGLAGAGGLPVVAPLVSLAAFVAGSAAGGVLALKLAGRHATHIAWALTIEVLLIAAAALLSTVVTVHAGRVSGDAVIVLLAVAMGVRNATVRRVGVPDLTTTVLTMTLTGLAADSRLAGGSGGGSARRVAAVIAMLAGAIAGALMVKSSITLALVVALAVAFLAGLAYTRLSAPAKVV